MKQSALCPVEETLLYKIPETTTLKRLEDGKWDCVTSFYRKVFGVYCWSAH